MNPLLSALLAQYSVQVDELMDLLEAARITPKAWRDRMAALLARYHYASMIVGGGTTAIPPAGLAILTQTIGSQFSYLNNFYIQVVAAEAFKNSWRARAQMYTRSASSSFWDGYIYQKAGRFLPIPAVPGDGSTQCLSNCRCSLRVVTKDEETADFDVYWDLNPAEHCQTCIERAKQWSPLRIRGGVLV